MATLQDTMSMIPIALGFIALPIIWIMFFRGKGE
jgi:hypothetical protein